MIGYAGSSNAFAISSRLGIPNAVIERAKQQIDSEAASFEKALGEAEQLRRLAEEERARLAEELQAKQAAFEKELEARQAKAAKLEKRAEETLEKARRTLETARMQANEAIDIGVRGIVASPRAC